MCWLHAAATTLTLSSVAVLRRGNTTNQFILTKGDNNPADDIDFYAVGQKHLDRSQVVGRVKG